MDFPDIEIPVVKIPLPHPLELYVKREDLINPEISGNKYWKLFYSVNKYLAEGRERKMIITFGGAFSNHISAVAALGYQLNIPTLGIIRGEEISDKWKENPTLRSAASKKMEFRFISREKFREKNKLTNELQREFPDALIIPEGGTNQLAVEGIQHMLNDQTKRFDYLCTAVGTGGTIAGLSKFAEESQKVLGFCVVKDQSLSQTIHDLSKKHNFMLLDASFGGYGKITEEIVRFSNSFRKDFGIQLDPIYTGKMMMRIFQMIEEGYFSEGSKILAFHTGGLQGIEGANQWLKRNGKTLLDNNTLDL